MNEAQRIAVLEKALRDIQAHCWAATNRGETSVRVAAIAPIVKAALEGGTA